MLLFADFLLRIRRLVIIATAVALAAIVWTTVVRFAAAPAPGQLSEFLVTLGTRLLAPFDSLAQPATLSNGGALSWVPLGAMLAYTLLGAGVAWLLVRASDRLMERYVVTLGPSLEELAEQAPESPVESPSSFIPRHDSAPSH